MKRRKISKFAGLLAAAMLLSGCGSSSEKAAYNYESAVATEAAYDMGSGYMTDDVYVMEMAEVEETSASVAEESRSAEVKDTERKLIKNVDLYVETETFETLLATVESKTEGLGGYIESSYTYNGSSYYGGSKKNASLTIRIPAEQLDTFLSAVSEASNVISRNDRIEDVTLQYVDLASHKKTLQAEQTRLLELLEEAETVEDMIALESRLSEVRYQIESMESQLRTYDNQIDYSTVYLEVEEVNKITPVKEQSIAERIMTGFTENLYDVGGNLLEFGIWLITHIPALTVWVIVLIMIWLIFRGIRKHCRNKKLKKQPVISGEQNGDPKEEKEKAGEKK